MAGMETVVLMAKAPIPGRVKTRLSPPLSPEDAARLYEGLLLDAAATVLAVPRAQRLLFYAPAGSGRRFAGAAFAGFRARPQRGSDLGERMTRAIDAAFSEGARRVVIVGADCPALSPARIGQAFRELRDGADVVFGPAADGGFYLAGFAAAPGTLFECGIAWGSGSVLAAVVARCRSRRLSWSLLPEERDVDTADDLAWLEERKAGGWFPRRAGASRRPARAGGITSSG
jgi:rSAM/selenodomain-associated transferase 1